MLKKTITFTGFDGEERTTDLYFNLTKTELVDWSADSENGIQYDMEEAIRAKDMRKLLDFMKDLVFRSYGIRDKDGVHFDKSPEISRRFENSAMYDPLMLELFSDEGSHTSDFITGLMPADLVQEAMRQANIPMPGEAAKEYEPSARERFAQQQANQAPAAAPVQATQPSPQDAAPTQVTQPADAPRAFRVKETPLDEGAAEEVARREAAEASELEEFKAWKASQQSNS